MSSLRKRTWFSATAAMFLASAACRGPERPAENELEAPLPSDETNAAEALPLPEPTVDRAAFLAAMATAASPHTAGSGDDKAQPLDGRRFSIRLRFGCDGPAADGSDMALRWSHDEAASSLEIRAKPDLSLPDEPLKAITDQTIEAVEGFWVPRPWQTGDACPASKPVGTEGAMPAPQLVGIAQYFTPDDSRVGRRSGRPYAATQKVQSPNGLPKSGLILLLEGRFEPWPGGQVIRCMGSGRNRQPTCIASAHLDRAAFIRPETEAIIAEWRD